MYAGINVGMNNKSHCSIPIYFLWGKISDLSNNNQYVSRLKETTHIIKYTLQPSDCYSTYRFDFQTAY